MIINQTVSGGGGNAPAHYIEKTADANNKLQNSNSFIDLSGVTDIGDRVLRYAYSYNNSIPSAIDMSGLTAITGTEACANMFDNNRGIRSLDLSNVTNIGYNSCTYLCYYSLLTSVDLSSLITIDSYGLQSGFYSTDITSFSLPNLTTIYDYALSEVCNGCSYLTSVSMPNLVSAGDYSLYYAFSSSAITSLSLPSLTTVDDYGLAGVCQNCGQLTSVSFGALDPSLCGSNIFGHVDEDNYAFSSCPNLTAIHFPASAQSAIEQWDGYSDKWGADNATIYFDL